MAKSYVKSLVFFLTHCSPYLIYLKMKRAAMLHRVTLPLASVPTDLPLTPAQKAAQTRAFNRAQEEATAQETLRRNSFPLLLLLLLTTNCSSSRFQSPSTEKSR